MENAALQKQVADLTERQNGGIGSSEAPLIPRPTGTVGTHFSIQDAMGLAGSKRKYETYKAIQVSGLLGRGDNRLMCLYSGIFEILP